MTAPGTPTRDEAIRILQESREAIEALLAQVPRDALERPGVGGGAWSPKDLVGHLASWEERALEALAAWERGERAPIDRELSTRKLSDINAEAVAATSGMTYAQVRRAADRTHTELLEAIRTMSDGRWYAPATARGRRPLGARLGQILLGTGPFDHALAHVKSLRRFVDALGA
ncbi:MAG: DinB family protein [Candidatus Velamenicoccus archaeovorus]